MCYLLYAQKLNKNADNELIIDILKNKTLFNNDGFSFFNDKKTLIRTLDNKEYFKALPKAIKQSNSFMAHLRQGTSGGITVTNIHCFEYKGWYFAHNGIIPEHSKGLTSSKSDSLLYFEKLVDSFKCLDELHIVKRIKKSGFGSSGRCVLISPDGKVYFFGDFDVYKIGGWLLFSSVNLTFTDKKTLNFGDLTLTQSQYYHDEIDGIYIYHPTIKKLYHKGELPTVKNEIGFKYGGYDYDHFGSYGRQGSIWQGKYSY